MLNVNDLHLATLTGYTFNHEENAALQTSLVLLRSAENFSGCTLWGKIWGIQKDYLIAECFLDDLLNTRKYFYSLDAGASWVQLPDPSSSDVKRAQYIYKRFIGDPAYETKPAKWEPEADDSSMSEEKRLAATVAAINEEAVLVPRGAYYRDGYQKIRPNDLFHGLTKSEATSLSSYLHFRAPPAGKLPQVRVQPDESLDIFESAELDAPKGAYTVKLEQGGKAVTVKSMQWPGYAAIQSLTTGKHASVYIGSGQRNHDLGFML